MVIGDPPYPRGAMSLGCSLNLLNVEVYNDSGRIVYVEPESTRTRMGVPSTNTLHLGASLVFTACTVSMMSELVSSSIASTWRTLLVICLEKHTFENLFSHTASALFIPSCSPLVVCFVFCGTTTMTTSVDVVTTLTNCAVVWLSFALVFLVVL